MAVPTMFDFAKLIPVQHHLTCRPIITKVGGYILRLRFRTYLGHRRTHSDRIQDGGCRHLGFKKMTLFLKDSPPSFYQFYGIVNTLDVINLYTTTKSANSDERKDFV